MYIINLLWTVLKLIICMPGLFYSAFQLHMCSKDIKCLFV